MPALAPDFLGASRLPTPTAAGACSTWPSAFLGLDVPPAARPSGLRARHAWLDTWAGFVLRLVTSPSPVSSQSLGIPSASTVMEGASINSAARPTILRNSWTFPGQ